jgi:hypothetical protein
MKTLRRNCTDTLHVDRDALHLARAVAPTIRPKEL